MNLGYSYYHKKENTSLDFGRGIVGRSKSADLADLQEKYFKIEGDNIFSVTFKIRYPGLLVGLGYEHPKLSDNDDDFESGFTFDYTTGLPYIPGSSVKGVIRSAFPKQAEDAGRLEFVNELLGEEFSYNKIRKAENRLFGNRSDEEREFPHACQDIFFDGYISRISGQLFAEEYITPHKDPVSNPIPIKFLKIAPGNEITLQFGLNDAGENHLGRPAIRPGWCISFPHPGICIALPRHMVQRRDADNCASFGVSFRYLDIRGNRSDTPPAPPRSKHQSNGSLW